MIQIVERPADDGDGWIAEGETRGSTYFARGAQQGDAAIELGRVLRDADIGGPVMVRSDGRPIETFRTVTMLASLVRGRVKVGRPDRHISR